MHSFGFRDRHVSDYDLLFYLDGELAARKAGKCRTHLEHCWSCRARAAKLQDTIHSFAAFVDK